MIKSKKVVLQSLGKAAGNILFICFLLLLSSLVFFLVQSRLSGGPPTIAGNRIFAVMSGSMSPEFETGSLVAVKSVDSGQLQVGDIITFGDSDGQIVTHRIVAIEAEGGLSFVTKGDANDVVDSGTVPADRVIGVVAFALPWLGRILVFSQTKRGLLLMIIIPTLVILVVQGHSLWKYAVQADKEKARKLAEENSEGEATEAI